MNDCIDSMRNMCRVTDKKCTQLMKMRRLLDEDRFSNAMQVLHGVRLRDDTLRFMILYSHSYTQTHTVSM